MWNWFKSLWSKRFRIIINGREEIVTKSIMSFDEIATRAGFYDVPNIVYLSITYFRGDASKPEGMLTVGETVRIKAGMVFNVTSTSKGMRYHGGDWLLPVSP